MQIYIYISSGLGIRFRISCWNSWYTTKIAIHKENDDRPSYHLQVKTIARSQLWVFDFVPMPVETIPTHWVQSKTRHV